MTKLEQWKNTGKPFYISITGLQPKGFWSFFHFVRHAIPSRAQAMQAEGNLFLDTRMINGVQHTLTAWETPEHMRKYIHTGAHLLAIKAFRKIATGKTFGFEGTVLPNWDEVHELWKTRGVSY